MLCQAGFDTIADRPSHIISMQQAFNVEEDPPIFGLGRGFGCDCWCDVYIIFLT